MVSDSNGIGDEKMNKKIIFAQNQQNSSLACFCRCCHEKLDERKFDNLKEIISDYIEHYRPIAETNFLIFKNLDSLKDAVAFVGSAKCPVCGKKFGHQRRIPSKILDNAKLKLLDLLIQIQNCHDFEELIWLLENNIKESGIGDLTIYDMALRIGDRLGIEPMVVYLHAGTKRGAKTLKINIKRKFFYPSELPDEFKELSVREIEDCLCIYKDHLAYILKISP